MMPMFESKACAWGNENGYGIVEYVVSEEGAEIYYLFDKSLFGKKTGVSRFLKIYPDGTMERSFNWTHEKITKLYNLYLTKKQPTAL